MNTFTICVCLLVATASINAQPINVDLSFGGDGTPSPGSHDSDDGFHVEFDGNHLPPFNHHHRHDETEASTLSSVDPGFTDSTEEPGEPGEPGEPVVPVVVPEFSNETPQRDVEGDSTDVDLHHDGYNDDTAGGSNDTVVIHNGDYNEDTVGGSVNSGEIDETPREGNETPLHGNETPLEGTEPPHLDSNDDFHVTDRMPTERMTTERMATTRRMTTARHRHRENSRDRPRGRGDDDRENVRGRV